MMVLLPLLLACGTERGLRDAPTEVTYGGWVYDSLLYEGVFAEGTVTFTLGADALAEGATVAAEQPYAGYEGYWLATLPPEAPLFAVSSHGFYKNLKAYAERAGLTGVTPHVLRHSAAKLRRDTGATIEDVGSFLGHRSLHTTSRYLARLEGERDTGWHGVAAALGVD